MSEVQKPVVPLSETLIVSLKEGTKDDCIKSLRELAIANPEIAISRNFYRVNGLYAESVWTQHFGTFEEFKRQAGIVPSRQHHQMEKHIAKHASVDHYRNLNVDRQDYAEKYIRESKTRFKTAIIVSDLHDKEVDPFFMDVLVDTVKRVQPDLLVFNGDIFDLPEFGKYTIDPREWGVVERIKFAHEQIFKRLREVAPKAQFDMIEGNHEARLLKHMADATPALKAVLSDLHGFTVSKLLGLHHFEINYIAKGDLAAFNKQNLNSELRKNYKVYWDALLCHHFPDAKNWGLPGVNGHHHKHVVTPMYNQIYGAYEWHQAGCGHQRDASYCMGEKWHMGFVIANIDTETKATQFDYVHVGEKFAVSGGKWYYRKDEIVTL